MGEKGNVTSEELAASAAAGGLGAHGSEVAGVVRDTVVGRGVDAVIDRRQGDESEDPSETPPDTPPDTPRTL